MSESDEMNEEPGLGMDLPELAPAGGAASGGSQPYLVLARKYRPQTFSELIGQDAMVQTLANAIQRDRLAHAFLMTGVRGVGKTSTARLLAKSLNCVGPDGQGGPTISPCGVCEPCKAIAEGRHMDVMEMDAASNTGVDDAREIIDAVKYAAVSARYKIYIIDEAHMLSKNAWNALLKTLEEPPPHVKFIFATTEVKKLLPTVLSRCQRFDLRRIPASLLTQHFAKIAEAEGIPVEQEALAIIARASEGSVRDGLSILDQAIANAALDNDGRVTAPQVRAMLGLTDGVALRDLMSVLLAGDAPAMLTLLEGNYAQGGDPLSIINGLLGLIHSATRLKVGATPDPAASEEERAKLAEWAGALSHARLHRIWQLLLKASHEVAHAAHPMEACEMGLLRVIHAGEMPDPSDLARMLTTGVTPSGDNSSSVGNGSTSPPPAPSDFAALYQAVSDKVGAEMTHQLHDYVEVVRYEPPHIGIKVRRELPENFPDQASLALSATLGAPWTVAWEQGDAQPSLYDAEHLAEARARAELDDLPMVIAAKAAFPGAKIIEDNELSKERVSR